MCSPNQRLADYEHYSSQLNGEKLLPDGLRALCVSLHRYNTTPPVTARRAVYCHLGRSSRTIAIVVLEALCLREIDHVA
jgi:hypothetical protein